MAQQAEKSQFIQPIEMETKTLLEQWGRWAREDPARSLLYPHIEPYRKLYALPGESAAPRCCISDTLASAVDKLMAKLIARDGEMGRLTWQYYVDGCDYLRLSKITGVHRERVASLVRAGTAWMDAAIFC